MEAIHSSEMLVTIYKTTQHYNSEDYNQHLYCHENLKSQDISRLMYKWIIFLFWVLEYAFQYKELLSMDTLYKRFKLSYLTLGVRVAGIHGTDNRCFEELMHLPVKQFLHDTSHLTRVILIVHQQCDC
jgi:hypothetical protein